MTREEKELFRQLGRESYQAAEPCIPYNCKRLTDRLYRDGIYNGMVVNEEHVTYDCKAMGEWIHGWTDANLEYGGSNVR